MLVQFQFSGMILRKSLSLLGSFILLKMEMSKFPSSSNCSFYGLSVFQMDCHGGVSGTIYEYGALTIDGEEYIPFKQYIGKYVLFVNVASY